MKFEDKLNNLIVVENSNQDNIAYLIDCDSELYKLIKAEINNSFYDSLLKLSHCTRNFVGDYESPNILLLSSDEGCFPRKGITLNINGEIKKLSNFHYVDLVLDSDYLNNGNFYIYSHELAHVMMDTIMDSFPKGKTTKQHVSMGVTDYLTAFYEGWAIQFERHAYNNVKKYKKNIEKKQNCITGLASLWHCEIDSLERVYGVTDNRFVHKKIEGTAINTDMADEDIILFNHTSINYDKIQLKNSQEMLSNEGVIATIFYRITSSLSLQNNYLEKSFYNKFTIGSNEYSESPDKAFTPFENIIIKSLWIFNLLNRNISDSFSPMIDFIRLWCNEFPDDKSEILDIFLSITKGKTINNELAVLFEEVKAFGMMGNIYKLKSVGTKYKAKYQDVLEQLLSGKVFLDDILGDEIWVEIKEILVRTCLWDEGEKLSHKFNLNTATIHEIQLYCDIDKEHAVRLVTHRDRLRLFESIRDFRNIQMMLK